MQLTHHTSARLQQLAIPLLTVDLFARYGRQQHTRDGTVLLLDARGREPLTDSRARFDKFADTCLVEAAETGAAVTVGHRARRLRRRRVPPCA